jgi:nucleotide-binding universal stress UspA family protein
VSAICSVITGVSGSPRNFPAVRYATSLARSQGATLILVLAWIPPGGEYLAHQLPSPCLWPEWERAARQSLCDAIDMALGGEPAGLSTELTVVRGEPGPVLVHAAGRAGDLLVVGTGRRGTRGRLAGGRVSRYCLARAGCPVLTVPPASLEMAAAHGRHRWGFRRHGLNLSELSAGR